MVAVARTLPIVACVLSLLAARSATPSAPVAASSPRFTNPTGPPNAIQWLVVSPRDPRTLYVGRYDCPMVFLRSRDAGRTWRSLLDAAQICINGSGGEASGGNALTGPLQIAANGRTLFLDELYNPGSFDLSARLLLSSADGGDHWSIPDHAYDQGTGTAYAVLGPPSPRPHGPQFLYTEYGGIGDTDLLVGYGDITGHSPNGGPAGAGTPPDSAAGAPGLCCAGAPVPDARDPTIVYVNLVNNEGLPGSPPGGAVRSEHNRPWAVVARPRARPSLRTFSVATDPHEAGLLVGRTQDPSVPPDRVYLSTDHGRTWRAAACPGVLRGSCPAAAIDGAFGAGASYAFVGDGLYRFHGAGPATARLPLSARLPVRSSAVAAVTGGPRPGGRGHPGFLPHAGRGADMAARRRSHPALAVGRPATRLSAATTRRRAIRIAWATTPPAARSPRRRPAPAPAPWATPPSVAL